MQYEILKLLAKRHRNLFVVGDDDQAIYGFRGSDPQYLLDFPGNYPDTKRVYLTVNHRCSSEIVASSSRLIQYNQHRYEKDCVSAADHGGVLVMEGVGSASQEADWVSRILRKRHASTSYDNMAVLYRSRRQAQPLVEQLRLCGIPYRGDRLLYNPMESELAQNLRAYLAWADGEREPMYWKRISSGFDSRAAVESVEALTDNPGIREQQMTEIEELLYHFRRLQGMKPMRALQYIWYVMGYREVMRKQCERQGMLWRDLKQHFRWLVQSAGSCETISEWVHQRTQPSAEGVLLSTMHGAKGLEFDTVIIIGSNEGICPWESADCEELLEEERRVFYVAMTRAKRNLYIIYDKGRRFGGKPSRFLREMET